MIETCGNCKFFLKNKIGNDGCCRAVPAVPIMVGAQKDMAGGVSPAIMGFFPPMNKDGWCGAWKAKVEVMQ